MLCNLCPNNCNIDRSLKKGYCGETDKVRIAKYYLHPFEEPVISGKNGSGTIFFCGCSLKCVFCQNYELSRSLRGTEISITRLAEIFRELELAGAHNISLVTATHYIPQIIEAFKIYKPKIPVVYNTHAYENLSALEQIDPYIDVYLPDLKFFSPKASMRYTKKADYFDVASKAVKFMMERKKTVVDGDGLMKSGVIVRHLILPLNKQDSKNIVEWFLKNRENGAYFSLMSQYVPYGDLSLTPELKRKITKKEYEDVLNVILSSDFEDCFIQDEESANLSFVPKWDM